MEVARWIPEWWHGDGIGYVVVLVIGERRGLKVVRAGPADATSQLPEPNLALKKHIKLLSFQSRS